MPADHAIDVAQTLERGSLVRRTRLDDLYDDHSLTLISGGLMLFFGFYAGRHLGPRIWQVLAMGVICAVWCVPTILAVPRSRRFWVLKVRRTSDRPLIEVCEQVARRLGWSPSFAGKDHLVFQSRRGRVVTIIAHEDEVWFNSRFKPSGRGARMPYSFGKDRRDFETFRAALGPAELIRTPEARP
jgi:hypothetical protein